MSKNPSWIQFSDDAWGEAVGPTEYDSFLDSLDGPTIPAQSLEPLPDHDAPLLLTWITEHLAELAADEQFRVIGPHGLTFHQHADKLMEVAHLDAARRSATGDLRDQLTGQHREAKQELDDFERSVKFQSALRYRLEAAGPAFERIASATPENQAAVLFQQQAAARYEGLKALIAPSSGTQSQPVIIEQAQDRTAAAADESSTPQREAGKARYDELRTQMAGYLTTPNTPSDIKTVQMDKAKVAGESTPRDVSKKEALPVGVTRSEILSVFPPLRGQTAEQWKKMLSDPPKWMEAARLDPGRRGIQSIWNPALFAICLAEKGKMQRRPLGAIIGRSFPEYLPEWEGYAGTFN